jgi:hypothetical protein
VISCMHWYHAEVYGLNSALEPSQESERNKFPRKEVREVRKWLRSPSGSVARDS